MAPIVPANISIPPVAGAASPFGAAGPGSSAAGSGGLAFQSVFSDAVNQVQQFQSNASASVGRFVSGEGEELHQVALATQQADLAFNLFLQVRNKVISAYQEVMRMQV